ncbi:MAG TPA: TlpA disulfide reductase family protein [Steroidobacteraceae bacterium]|nr:TlpA disulfide reductase family protein [Steroidobacteraceae bacterium]
MRTHRALMVALLVAGSSGVAAVAAEQPATDGHPSLDVGSVPFDELGKDVDGNKVTISEHRGKVVIVSFWASWCAPCRKELPILAAIAKKVGPGHCKVIAINYHDEPKPFRAVADALKPLSITILRDSSGKAARKFEVKGIPRMIIIDRDGKVAADHTGYGEGSVDEIVDELNRVLQARET